MEKSWLNLGEVLFRYQLTMPIYNTKVLFVVLAM